MPAAGASGEGSTIAFFGSRKAMRIDQMIRELQKQKRDLDRVIALLEEVEQNRPEQRSYNASSKSAITMLKPSRRGRKFMTERERLAVSERMKRYWSARKAEENDAEASESEAAIVSRRREPLRDTRR